MHIKRWLSALTIIPILIFCIQMGGIVFTLLICTVSFIALWEYFSIVYNNTGRSLYDPLVVIGLVTGLLINGLAHLEFFLHIPFLIALNIICIGIIGIFRFKTDSDFLDAGAKELHGVLYVPLLLSYIILIRNSADGTAWIYFLLFMVFLGDTGAFYAGSFLGRTKLCPSVSPGKTLEGAMGGLLAAIGTGIIFWYFFIPDKSLGLGFLLFICVGIIGPAGDLYESMLKRKSGVKDSGKIMPGHGGLLDRIDALLFATPVLYYFKAYIL